MMRELYYMANQVCAVSNNEPRVMCQGEEIDSAEAEALFYDPDDDWQKDVDLSATPLRATVPAL